MPASERLIVEGAGGCLVPLNDQDFLIDIAANLQLPLVLVSDLYLGSINHTLLTVNLIRQRNLPLAGLVFNGEPNPESERIIEHHANCKVLLRIQREKEITPALVRAYAIQLKQQLP
jgi:dethiobiotin synthetase